MRIWAKTEGNGNGNGAGTMSEEAKKIIILGTGGTCFDIVDTLLEINDCANPLELGGPYELAGYLDDSRETGTFTGCKAQLPVLGRLNQATEFPDAWFINGIGSPRTFRQKDSLIQSTGISDSRFAKAIHPRASVSRYAEVGVGSVIFSNVVISANARVGRHVVVLPLSVVSHDSEVGDFGCIAGGVAISGNVMIGKSSYIGTHAAIRDGVNIGSGCLIGMGSVVTRDIASNMTVFGCPAKVVSQT